MVFVRAIVPVAVLTLAVEAQVYLAPEQDIVLPSSDSATNPLTSLGGNGPWYAGPNVNGVSNQVPEGCYVEQVHSISRHGSRYPDSGAYQGWVTLYQKIQAANFEASGSLAFLKSWKPVLTNPTVQIAAESPTGWKETFDMGYELRTKYPNLYDAGTPFYAWANLYPRVVATARNFLRGFLGETASTVGTVITVNATGSANALFDSLGPGDMCPNYVDGNGGTYATQWDSIYLPPITKRLNALLSGGLVLTDSDTSLFPYLCGFESQITGTLSPFCSTFSDSELRSYEYRQDLRYYYGSGPGTDLPSKMMLPYLNSVVEILAEGPGINGTAADGSPFTLPNLLVAFANDGQMNQLVGQLGVFDDQTPLSGSEIPAVWKFIASRFCSMRGTVTLERLQCKGSPSPPETTPTTTASASACSTPAITTKACNRDNCFRQMLQNEAQVEDFCGNYTQTTNTATTALPTFVSQCVNSPSRISSACSCLVTPSATPCSTSSTSSASSTPTSPISNTAYIRVLLNDAVYPVVGCDKGPGKSCSMAAYKKLVGQKLKDAGDLKAKCGVTIPGTPAVLGGSSFYRDLTGNWLALVKP